MAETMDKIIDKIKKMFALAQSSNENEAAMAMAMAHELLQKYNLSMTDIEAKGEKSELETDYYAKASHPWQVTLVKAISKANYCDMFISYSTVGFGNTGRAIREKTMVIVGKEHNVAAVKVMADYILGAIEKGSKKMYGTGKALVASYKVGFSQAVQHRLWMMRQQDMATSECRDLVVVADKEVEDFFKKEKMGTYKAESRAHDYAGYAAGALDGRNLPLNEQIGHKADSSKVALA